MQQLDHSSEANSKQNTNVIELYSRLEASDEQLNYYNSGVGTITKQKSMWKWMTQKFDSGVDLAIAWNFEKVIIATYRWLSERYKPGDRIFLFGFSRGAYQMRVLAAMIAKVGLIQEGNVEQIPFAFEIYKTEHNDLDASRFKNTFSMPNVRVHFLGVWTGWEQDIADDRRLGAHSPLDERRVKFIPECVMRKRHLDKNENPVNFDKEMTEELKIPVRRLKEVWFAGSHSDVGGGSLPNDGNNPENAPLLWMVSEAVLAGLHLKLPEAGCNLHDLHWTTEPQRSLHTFSGWWALERVPIHRQSRSSRSKTSYWHAHHGKSRAIYPGQKIHASVAFKDTRYRTKATFYPTPGALKKFTNSQRKAEDASPLQKILQSFLVRLDKIVASIVSKSLAIYHGAAAEAARLEAKAKAARVEAKAAPLEALVVRPEWSQLVAEGPSGNFHDDWKPRLEMDLFDLNSPSGYFTQLQGDLSDSHTLHVLHRLGFLASLKGGADAILSRDNKDDNNSRRLTLQRLLEREELIFLATVTLLARLDTAPSQETDGLEMENLLLSHPSGVENPSRYRYLVPAVEIPLAGQAVEGDLPRDRRHSHPQMPETYKGIADRIVHCLALEQPILEETVKTIIEIAPIGDFLKQMHSLGGTEKLVGMLSGKYATVSAKILVFLAGYGLAWQTIFELVRENKPNFNPRLRAPVKGWNGLDTRDAAAIIVSDLVDHLMTSQTTNMPFTPSGMTPEQVGHIIDGETIMLLNTMLVNEKRSDASAADALAKQKLSDSAADALAKLSCRAIFRDLILNNAATVLITMLSKHSGSAAKALAALILTGPKNSHDVQRMILGYERNTSQIGVTSKTEMLLLAIVDMLKAATARIIVESNAPKTILESLNKRDVTHLSAEEYTEYGLLMQCLAAIVRAHAKLRKKAKDASSRPLELTLVLQENGARLLFRLMGENSPECRAAADALLALAQHDHDDDITHKNEDILREVLDGQYAEFKANLENKLQQIKNSARGPPAGNLSALASDVASMTVTLAVLDRAHDTEQLVEVFTLLQTLWREAFHARQTNRKVANEYEDTYGEQADLAADAIGKAIRHRNHIVREQFAGSDSKADPKRLVSLLVERLGGHSHYGTWHAIKQLAKSSKADYGEYKGNIWLCLNIAPKY
ncbi:hypothetical protein FIBSPDRAFT_940431 [Athelia psychrophila]|uniref:T6SS Phospholipase effector Tle1-like catalytic domain-containing protein n=1 Tax=Athelia psychrophila TaxID=1759441 RepID=A0A167VZN7_9AGAM|nr:hypothetical protein FIBSPDRAFT_940431 [Fibularhizoctonia sp. CBS 109695]